MNNPESISESHIESWLGSRQRAILALALVAFAVSGVLNFSVELSTTGDNAQYFVLGQSLAEGQGYMNINHPNPTSHTKYPFGFPALLAVLYPFFGFGFLGYKIVLFLLSICTLLLLYKWLEDSPPLILVGSLLLFALNLKILEYSSLILSETPFLFFVVLGFYLFRRFETSGRTFELGLALLCWAVAYYMRSIGIALFPALIVHALIKKETRTALIALLVLVAVWVPWQLWVSGHDGPSYLKELQMKNPYEPHLGSVGLLEILFERMPANLKVYSLTYVPESIIPLFQTGPAKILAALGLLMTVIVVAGFWTDFRNQWDLKGWYFLATMGIVLMWPEVWSSERFLFGLIPLTLFYFVGGIARIVGRVTSSESARSLGVTVVVGLLLLGTLSMHIGFENQQTRYTAAWRNYRECAVWIQANTPTDAVVACRKPALAYLWSGRKSISIMRSSDKDETYRVFNVAGVTHLILDSVFRTASLYLKPILMGNKQDFPRVYGLNNPITFVCRFQPAATPGGN